MSLLQARLNDDQGQVADLARELSAALPSLAPEGAGDVDAGTLQEVRAGLVESGLWSIGVDESLGGGGASLDLRQIALVALGGAQPALAWGIAQADCAAQVLAGDDSLAGSVVAVVSGTRPVSVVEMDAPHVDLVEQDGGLTGVIERIDPCGDAPLVIVLGDDLAWIIDPGAVRATQPRRTTGLAGAATMSAEVDGSSGGVTRISGADVPRIRARLQLGGAAVAAGLAISAAESAAAYTRERVQFGGPLTNLPTVRRSLAEQQAAATASLEAAIVGEEPHPDRAAGILRDNCERAISVTADALLSHGGYGYLQEYDVERMVRDAVSLRAATGAYAAFRRSADRFASH
jgi:alkylation response protein AidB-like acyl-CoA dehydrogenase